MNHCSDFLCFHCADEAEGVQSVQAETWTDGPQGAGSFSGQGEPLKEDIQNLSLL